MFEKVKINAELIKAALMVKHAYYKINEDKQDADDFVYTADIVCTKCADMMLDIIRQMDGKAAE